MPRGLDDIDPDSILNGIRGAVRRYNNDNSDYPPVWIEDAYLRGSYVIDKATETSDIDVLVVLGTDTGTFAPSVLATHILRAHGEITAGVEKYAPTECDLKIIPADDTVRREADAPKVEDYLNGVGADKGYFAYYNLETGELTRD